MCRHTHLYNWDVSVNFQLYFPNTSHSIHETCIDLLILSMPHMEERKKTLITSQSAVTDKKKPTLFHSLIFYAIKWERWTENDINMDILSDLLFWWLIELWLNQWWNLSRFLWSEKKNFFMRNVLKGSCCFSRIY